MAEGTLAERLRMPFRDAAEAVFLHGSTPWEVDEAMEGFGFVAGPFEIEDRIGLDLAWERRKAGKAPEGLPILVRMMELGKLGRKTGAGWYRYPGGNGKVDDPIVADLALEEAHFHRLERGDYTPEEIRERLLVALVAAARELQAAGVAARDIDAVSIEALGFPSDKGGVLSWAARDPAGLAAMTRAVQDEGKVPLRPTMGQGR
ncbi:MULTISPECIES: 3-hydroxyacyl-CoA dehydrogenase family protein [unclassified Mameliella]|uniref:3-hydroxyacyl-CoA dehydrogenase family protein n=1 Tax=unclassified Mameliella TaxID=2630630 RepID=UPI00273ECD65|nr:MULTISPECIES: 3-hydroxyacyl-CoA dehydrogenase family protein [unclassified Mameliella]